MKLSNAFLIIASGLLMAVPASAVIFTIDFETDLSQTPVDLDNGPTIDMLSVANPLTANVAEDPASSLTISVVSADSFDPTVSNVNTSGAGLGINSPTPPVGTENASRFDVDAQETLEFVFNMDVNIISVDLVSLTGTEEFTFGSVTGINDANTDNADIFTFAGGGLFFAAGTPIFLEATGPAGTSVGLDAITLEVIPEPTTSLLIGLSGLFMIARRRRH